jgi:hypothetical protein
MKRLAAVWAIGAMLGCLSAAAPAEAQPPAQYPRQPKAEPVAPAEPEAPPPATPPPAAVPPGYVLVPAAQAQTRYDVQYPQSEGALPPDMELPYEEGQRIPPGFRLVEKPRRGFIIAGSVVTGVLWALSTVGAVAADFEDHSGWLVVPGAGPWLMLLAGGARDHCQNVTYGTTTTSSCASNSGLRATLTLDGIGQTAGAILFISGFAFPTKRLIRQDVTVSVLPTRVGRDGYGLGVVGAF